MNNRLLEADNVSKEYRRGQIGGQTLQGALMSRWARFRGKEDPNTKIGTTNTYSIGDTFLALDGVTFNVDRGDAVALIGRNGAGKSTLLKVISRITAPSAGELRIRGRVASLLEIGTGFHRELSGRDNIYLNGAILGMNRAEINRKLSEIIEFSEIGDFIDTPVKRYSSGMFVKLGFAVAAHLDPDLLICDEILAVGDQTFQQKCITKMREVATSGCAVMYVSHNMHTVAQLCNRGLFLNKGKLEYDGTVEHAIERYSNAGEVVTDINVDEMKRNERYGKQIRVLRMQYRDTINLEYEMDSTMCFDLTIRANITEKQCYLRYIMISSMAAPVACSMSNPFELKAGETTTVHVKLPLDGLAPAVYRIKIALFSARMGGNSSYYDVIGDVGFFTITENPERNNGFRWVERTWGNYRMKNMEVD